MPGYSIRISGQFEAASRATRLISILSIISFVAMFLILYMHFKSINPECSNPAQHTDAFVGAAAYIVISPADDVRRHARRSFSCRHRGPQCILLIDSLPASDAAKKRQPSLRR